MLHHNQLMRLGSEYGIQTHETHAAARLQMHVVVLHGNDSALSARKSAGA